MPKLVAAAFLLLVKVSIRLVFPRCLWSFHLHKIKVPNYHWGSSSNLRITPLSSIELSFKVSNVSPEKCKETDNLLDKVKAPPSKQLLEDWTLHLPLIEMTSFLYPSSVQCTHSTRKGRDFYQDPNPIWTLLRKTSVDTNSFGTF